jgi:hypothetical protein
VIEVDVVINSFCAMEIAHLDIIVDFVECVFIHAALAVVVARESLIILEHLMRSFT